MTHDFTTLTSVLSRCSAKVADQVIAEISNAISAAKQDDNHADEAVTEMAATVHKINAEKAAARREKAAARRAAKKAAANDSAERSESPRSGSVAVASRLAAGSAKPSGAEAPDEAAARCESCGEAEAELPSASSSGAAPCTAFTDKMVKYLRQCPAQHMLAVLNSYVHLLFTGNLIHSDADHRFLENFIYLARLESIIQNDQQPTIEQAAAFLFDNPALPLPRAERRRLQRLARKHRLTYHR